METIRVEILKSLKKNSDESPSLEEITAEVEAVRRKRYENQNC